MRDTAHLPSLHRAPSPSTKLREPSGYVDQLWATRCQDYGVQIIKIIEGVGFSAAKTPLCSATPSWGYATARFREKRSSLLNLSRTRQFGGSRSSKSSLVPTFNFQNSRQQRQRRHQQRNRISPSTAFGPLKHTPQQPAASCLPLSCLSPNTPLETATFSTSHGTHQHAPEITMGHIQAPNSRRTLR